MAVTTGLVQQFSITPAGRLACVYIGPTTAAVDALVVAVDAGDPPHTCAFAASMLDALAQAFATRREVTVSYVVSPTMAPRIYSVELR